MPTQDRPDIIDALAAEYVLGTLRGPARRRFEKLRVSVPLADERCRFWAQNLMALARGLQPVQPPPHVWQGIRTRLGLVESPRRPRIARVWAIAASVLLVAGLSALLYWNRVSTRPTEVASITTQA